MLNKKDLKILFLAKYAPIEGVDYLLDKNSIKLLVKYHQEIFDVLNEHYTVISSNKIDDIIKYRHDIDYVFSLYNDAPFRNSEIFVSSICEYAKVAYLGAPPNIRGLAEDKHIAKMVALYAGIPTAKWIIWNSNKSFDINSLTFEGPYFVKPRYGSASKYISENNILFTKEEVYDKVTFFVNQNVDVIIEEYIQGIYHTVPIYSELGKIKLLPCMKETTLETENIITHTHRIDIDNVLTPIFIDDNNLIHKLNTYTKNMFKLIEPLDFARFDYIVSEKDGTPYFLELNICCSLGSYAEFAISANHKGISYDEMILSIVKNSINRQIKLEYL